MSAQPTVAVIGTFLVDILGRPVGDIPQGQASVRIEQIRITAAGSGAGTAVDLARLGAKVYGVGARSTDVIGTVLAGLLADEGIDSSLLKVLDGAQTSASMLPIRPNGDRPALHVPGINGLVRVSDLTFPAWEGIDGLHLGGVDAMRNLETTELVGVLKAAKSAGVFVSMDVQSGRPADNRSDILDLLPYVDVFMPNLEQAQSLVNAVDPEAVLLALLNHGAASVILTLGPDGSLYGSGVERRRTPVYPVEVLDTTGCGDAFCAAYLMGALRGVDVPERLQLATAAGSLTATGLGSDAGIVGWDQLVDYVRAADVRGRLG
ncbi:hypothetical protein CLV47_106143 [Antricoccus suffuscus]|uniref:Carbohydrate kinase PfkB domain-containing protein n=1 Tax=Antricoccus suffuscus TaxID=1629062 RepID=A0A2T1A0Z0_9ACTN|nr:carbohydrate kinase family protein [Antricoccus suffuscus]PRZ42272.1 hypothetical protein CLV47_106143 [Antricoccus suffuscus]